MSVQSAAVFKPPANMGDVPAPLGPGKSANAVGQLAKQAVSAAQEAGITLPKNAQGFAASQIARGADPASLFAVQTDDVLDDAPDMTADEAGAPVVTAGGVEGGAVADGDVTPFVSSEMPDGMPDAALDVAADEAGALRTAATDGFSNAAAVFELTNTTSARVALDLLR